MDFSPRDAWFTGLTAAFAIVAAGVLVSSGEEKSLEQTCQETQARYDQLVADVDRKNENLPLVDKSNLSLEMKMTDKDGVVVCHAKAQTQFQK